MNLNLTRRDFIKIVGIGTFLFLVLKIYDMSNTLNLSGTIQTGKQTFSVTIEHTLSDSDNGKAFVIPNFPTNCIIKEIRVRSNFTAEQQNWRVAFVDKSNGIGPDNTEIICKTAEIFEVGDYVFIGDEIVYVRMSDPVNNLITVKRGVKGTLPMYHNNGSRIETANDGLRIILFNKLGRSVDSMIMEKIHSWSGTTNLPMAMNDNIIKLTETPVNINKNDIIYLNAGIYSEMSLVISTNGIADNDAYSNIIYIKDPLSLPYDARTKIQKQIVYNIPIIYSGEDINLYGILYVDEKIDDIKYPNGINVVIEIDVYPL